MEYRAPRSAARFLDTKIAPSLHACVHACARVYVCLCVRARACLCVRVLGFPMVYTPAI